MGLVDGFKSLVDGLTGEKERQRQQQAEQEQQRKQKLQEDRDRQVFEDKAAERALEQKVQADKLNAQRDRETKLGPVERLIQREVKQPEPQPEKPREEVAVPMQLQPAGLQRGPSMGGPGIVFVPPNVNVRPAAPSPQPEPQQQPQPQPQRQTEQQRETFLERSRREQAERIAALTPDQRREMEEQRARREQEREQALAQSRKLKL